MSPVSGLLAFLDGIGLSEMLVLAFVSILVFGGRLPDVLRNLGRGYAKFRQGLHDVSRPIRDELQHVTTLPASPAPSALPRTASAPAEAPPPAPPGTYDVPASPGGPDTAAATETEPRPWPPSRSSDPFDEPPPV